MTRLINWTISQRYLICLLVAILMIFSVVFVPRMSLDAFPDVTNIQVAVNTQVPSMSAQEVEQLISIPIESAMYTLPDVVEVRSISKNGLSGVTVIFKDDMDLFLARQLVFEQLRQLQTKLPQGIEAPVMGPNTSGLGQIYQYRLNASAQSNIDNRQLRTLNDWVVKQLLIPIEGITDVLSFGGEVKQFNIALNPNLLKAYDLIIDDVALAITANNVSAGGWFLEQGATQNAIRGHGWIASQTAVDDLLNLPVKTIDGHAIRLADIAEVTVGSEPRVGAVTMSVKDDKHQVQPLGEIVTGIVLKRMGANTFETIAEIKSKVATINQALPKGVTFEPIYEQSNLVAQAVNTITQSLFVAFILVFVVLFLFLLDLRATFLVLLTIPVSIALALLVMSLFGLSANLMSLGGLAIALGMLVDGSVVIVENMLKHVQAARTIKDGLTQAVSEVAKPVFIASLMILIVFLPLFSFEGVEAKLFEPMAIAIILAVVAALFCALLLVPAVAALLFRSGYTSPKSAIFNNIEVHYKQLLMNAFRSRRLILSAALVTAILCGYLLNKLGTEFIPKLEEGTLNIRVTLAPSSTLDTALMLAPKLERALLQFDVVESVISRIGRAELGGDPEPINNMELYVTLKPVELWPRNLTKESLQVQMQKVLETFPGLLLNFSQPIETRVDELLSGVKAQIAVKIYGDELNVLQSLGHQVTSLIAEVPGASDVSLEQVQGELQIAITPKRDVLARLGVSVAQVMNVIEGGIAGVNVSQIYEQNAKFNINIRYHSEYRNSEYLIARLPIKLPDGGWVELQNVATIATIMEPSQIRRDGLARRVVIGLNVLNRDMGSVVEDIKTTIENSNLLPNGYYIDIGGQYENQRRAQQRLMFIIPLAICLIALLLYFIFKSWRQTALILTNIPFAAAGGILALYFSGQYLSVPSAIGFIAVFGIAILNGVVLVESINLGLQRSNALYKAIVSGAVSRLKPVLMTASTTLLGLLPMLYSSGIGAEIQKPLATVIAGGVVTSTLLTLLLLPLLFPLTAGKTRPNNNLNHKMGDIQTCAPS